MITPSKREQIWKSLGDKEYRDQFVEEEINVGIAFQIRALRNRQKLTQGDLATLFGGKQSLVSSWENPDYGKYTLGTLKELAKAFDVGLSVRFVPYSTLVDQAVNLSNNEIAPPSFKEERFAAFGPFSAPSAPLMATKDIDLFELKYLEGKKPDISTSTVNIEKGVLINA